MDSLNSILELVYEKFPGEKEYSEQVAEICCLMAKEQGFTEKQLEDIKAVSLLHDIGKVTLSGVNLFKPGKLDEIEWIELKRHPEIGYRILSSNSEVGKLAEYILTHHENWDGSGYPGGLKGEEIPLPSRIVRIADAYVAMTSHRNYRADLTREQVIQELKKNAGTQFDPYQVEIFLAKVLPRLN
jgi:HD-GYP domain-containing protein (c-di-GMP phosphodiesterase class II)